MDEQLRRWSSNRRWSFSSFYVNGLCIGVLAVDGRLLSRITGTVFLLYERTPKEGEVCTPERINIGLSLKLSKRNQEV